MGNYIDYIRVTEWGEKDPAVIKRVAAWILRQENTSFFSSYSSMDYTPEDDNTVTAVIGFISFYGDRLTEDDLQEILADVWIVKGTDGYNQAVRQIRRYQRQQAEYHLGNERVDMEYNLRAEQRRLDEAMARRFREPEPVLRVSQIKKNTAIAGGEKRGWFQWLMEDSKGNPLFFSG